MEELYVVKEAQAKEDALEEHYVADVLYAI
jgi:hypothetical protein